MKSEWQTAPNFIIAGLDFLAAEIERVEWNKTQKEFQSPTRNYGTHYKTNIFKMCSYYWGEEQNLMNRPNFKYGKFEITWYKYLGRGTYINKEIDANEFFKIIDKCITNVKQSGEQI